MGQSTGEAAGMPLGTVKHDCPDCGFAEMELLVWPQLFNRSIYKLQCHKCFHQWVIDKKMNEHYLALLEPGGTTWHVD
jgi:hypothetical protein